MPSFMQNMNPNVRKNASGVRQDPTPTFPQTPPGQGMYSALGGVGMPGSVGMLGQNQQLGPTQSNVTPGQSMDYTGNASPGSVGMLGQNQQLSVPGNAGGFGLTGSTDYLKDFNADQNKAPPVPGSGSVTVEGSPTLSVPSGPQTDAQNKDWEQGEYKDWRESLREKASEIKEDSKGFDNGYGTYKQDGWEVMDPNKHRANEQYIERMRRDAFAAPGTSEWLKYQQEQNKYQTQSDLDALSRQGSSNMASQQGNLAMRGGLSSGASERMGTQNMYSQLMGGQHTRRSSAARGAGNMVQEAERQRQLLQGLGPEERALANQKWDMNKGRADQLNDIRQWNEYSDLIASQGGGGGDAGVLKRGGASDLGGYWDRFNAGDPTLPVAGGNMNAVIGYDTLAPQLGAPSSGEAVADPSKLQPKW